MPTILTHAALPLIAGLASGGRLPRRLVAAGMVVAMLPDLDVAGMALGVPYGAPMGHRGASHSLAAAIMLGVIALVAHRGLGATGRQAFWFIALSAASHGLTDMLTNGGKGVALLWPLSDARIFAPVRPVEVSAIGLSHTFWETFASELRWLILPALLIGLLFRGLLLIGRHRLHIDLTKGQS